MTPTERRVFGLLGGLLVVFLLVWFREPLAEAFKSVLIAGASLGLLLVYVRWVYAERALRAWLPPALLLGCLLLAAGVKVAVYRRAHTVSYVREERWISETVFYSPEYDGEDAALELLLGGPLAGLGVLLLGAGPRPTRPAVLSLPRLARPALSHCCAAALFRHRHQAPVRRGFEPAARR
jgi:hypothetical protein